MLRQRHFKTLMRCLLVLSSAFWLTVGSALASHANNHPQRHHEKPRLSRSKLGDAGGRGCPVFDAAVCHGSAPFCHGSTGLGRRTYERFGQNQASKQFRLKVPDSSDSSRKTVSSSSAAQHSKISA